MTKPGAKKQVINFDQSSLSQISKRSLPFFNDSSHFDNFSESLSNVVQNHDNMFDHSHSSNNQTKQLFKNELLINKDSRERFNGILKSRLPFQQRTTNENEFEVSADSFTAAQQQPSCQLCGKVYANSESIDNRPMKLYCCENTLCGKCLQESILLHQPAYKFRIKCKICSNLIDGKYIHNRCGGPAGLQLGMVNFGDQFLKHVNLAQQSDPDQIKTAICSAHISNYQILEKLEMLKFKRIKNAYNNPYIKQVKEWQKAANHKAAQNFMAYYN